MSQKQYIITLDGGTTNTRASLWNQDGQWMDTQGTQVGVRNTAMDGDNHQLCQAVKLCIETLLERNHITWEDILYITAAGMITSNVGLVEIPHLPAPAGLEELAQGMVCKEMPEICPIPIHFIPGIKNTAQEVDLDNFEAMDMMSGEEVESMALIHRFGIGTPMLLVLPGSHSKFVGVNERGQVVGCLTSITGELLSVITNHTILADAVEHNFVDEAHYQRDMMLLGYCTCARVGLGRACFSGRVMKLFAQQDHDAVANYLLGCVLESDIQALQGSHAIHMGKNTQVVVAGKQPLSRAICDLLTACNCFSSVQEASIQGKAPLSGEGSLMVAQCRGL